MRNVLRKNIILSCLCIIIAILSTKTSIATREELRELNNVNIVFKEERGTRK